jgi:hypothetical protein
MLGNVINLALRVGGVSTPHTVGTWGHSYRYIFCMYRYSRCSCTVQVRVQIQIKYRIAVVDVLVQSLYLYR